MTSNEENFDFIIIGSGIVGLTLGKLLLENNRKAKVVILEKDSRLAGHASTRNSGVIHAGFYYSAESHKARFCLEGNRLLKEYCKENKIDVLETGKVVVPRNEIELSRLEKLYYQGVANKVPLEFLPASKMSMFEPKAKAYGNFIWSPTTAISNPKQIAESLAAKFSSLGGKIIFNATAILQLVNEKIEIKGFGGTRSEIINCAGTHSLELAKQVGLGVDYEILPFLGIYKKSPKNDLNLKTLVYPVPDPVNPFLGVHITLGQNGSLKIGPTALPVIGREQYSLKNIPQTNDFINFAKGTSSLSLGKNHQMIQILMSELRKLSTSNLIRELEPLIPEISRVEEWKNHPPGIRAQLVDKNDGSLVKDFIFEKKFNSLHILNLVSPGWTSSFAIARHVHSNYLMDQ
jgi:L-2-hydroxyglutarate oxidase LhgO